MENTEELPIIVPVNTKLDLPEGHSSIFGDYFFRVMSGPASGYEFAVIDEGEFDENGKCAIISLNEVPEGKEAEYKKLAEDFVMGLFEMVMNKIDQLESRKQN